jgi:uncharacterized protein YbjT (DUF2867 family)
MNKTAIVFGASGLVGQELIAELLKNIEYEKIVAIVRKSRPITDPKLEQIILSDFLQLMAYQDRLNARVYFCCIGTTIKTAGSEEAFRKVDLGIPKQIAQLAEKISVPNLVIVSSIGADITSPNFYLRTKGEMETETRRAYTGNLKIIRPSLLIGNRKEFRFGEKIAVFFMLTFGWLFIGPLKKYRGIKAQDVARAMIMAARLPAHKVIYESDELQDMAYNYTKNVKDF